MDAFEKKVARAIKLLQSIPQDGEIEVSYSGGKDSDVILELAKMAGIPFRAIYKNTTIDPPGTIRHCREKGVEILQPGCWRWESENGKGVEMPTKKCSICGEVKEIEKFGITKGRYNHYCNACRKIYRESKKRNKED